MKAMSEWHPALLDPSGSRMGKPRLDGRTMVIDKGLGTHAFEDLLQTAAPYIDMIKIGFGTPALYPTPLLRKKIELARMYGISIYPGGTFLEVAVAQRETAGFFRTVCELGFTGVEVSDGTIEMSRRQRSELIARAVDADLTVYTEYGKKYFGFGVELEELVFTASADIAQGAELVTIEGRESGVGVGIYDATGACRDEELEAVLEAMPQPAMLLWEAPQKAQQVHLIRKIGARVNLGNIAPADVLALEALRRGLRSDTFVFGEDRKEPAPTVRELAWTYEI